MANMVSILNTIRAEATTEYQDIVPAATQANILAVGAPILTYSHIQNQFLTGLINKIAFQVIHDKQLINPLAPLKKGVIPLGSDIEEIFTNPAEAEVYDPTGATLLTVKKPDVKAIYHRMNRQDYFRVTVSADQLQTAFTSYENLEKLTSTIIATLYSGDNLAEFVLMKNTIADAVIGDKIIKSLVTAVTDDASGKNFIEEIQNASSYMEFPGTDFNKYPVTTWTPAEDQILIIRADVATKIGVQTLAGAFNRDELTMAKTMVKVDTFGAASNVLAILADKALFQIYDNKSRLADFFNPQGLTWTYFWHHWQTYSLSTFANAVAFVTADVQLAADVVEATVAGGTTAVPTYANAAAVIAALLISHPYVYFNDGLVKVPVTTYVNTDTYNAGAAASYTFTATLGTLPYGFGNTGTKKATIEVVVTAP